jgi:multidrug resistance efflux pump
MKRKENHIEAAITASYRARRAELEAGTCVAEAVEAGEGDRREALFLVAEALAAVAEHEQNTARSHLTALAGGRVTRQNRRLPKG